MEDTLREIISLTLFKRQMCLNPCFNGRYSQSKGKIVAVAVGTVLILVLMEDTLRESKTYESFV